MEWSTESIEKVICFVQERPFLFDVSSAELARKFDARYLHKKLVQVSWLCVTSISTCFAKRWSVAPSVARLPSDGRGCWTHRAMWDFLRPIATISSSNAITHYTSPSTSSPPLRSAGVIFAVVLHRVSKKLQNCFAITLSNFHQLW